MDTAPQLSLSDLLRQANGFSSPSYLSDYGSRGGSALLAAEVEWRAAIAALAHIMGTLPRTTTAAVNAVHEPDGIALSGPLPVLNRADFGQRLETWVVTPQPLAEALSGQHALMPASGFVPPSELQSDFLVLPLSLESAIVTERFCLVISPMFSVGLVLGQPTGDKACLQYSFDPQVLIALWQHIQGQLSPTTAEDTLHLLDQKISQTVVTPDYRLITYFSQLLLSYLPHRFREPPLMVEERGNLRFSGWAGEELGQAAVPAKPMLLLNPEAKDEPLPQEEPLSSGKDTELLQAMAHEIRTPLTTIRTLTRSLLRRQDLSPEVRKRLSRIDQECTQQIDRFNLIFRAVELETMERDRPRSSMAPIALTQIFQEAIPRWQRQAERRNLNLQVTLPPDLPKVTSDPTLLNEVLTGVVEWFTQCLPPQSNVHMRVMLAGHQLKLQFESEPQEMGCSLNGKSQAQRSPMKSVGQLLMVAPETGGLSLNLNATKNLFQFLGGKLILRQRPKQGEVLTAFLPLDTREV